MVQFVQCIATMYSRSVRKRDFLSPALWFESACSIPPALFRLYSAEQCTVVQCCTVYSCTVLYSVQLYSAVQCLVYSAVQCRAVQCCKNCMAAVHTVPINTKCTHCSYVHIVNSKHFSHLCFKQAQRKKCHSPKLKYGVENFLNHYFWQIFNNFNTYLCGQHFCKHYILHYPVYTSVNLQCVPTKMSVLQSIRLKNGFFSGQPVYAHCTLKH